MTIAANLKTKDFKIVSRCAGSRIAGKENLYAYDVYFNGKIVHTTFSKTTAKKWIVQKKNAVNSVLEKARIQERMN